MKLRHLLGLVLALGLVFTLACGPSEEEEEGTTPTPPTPTATPRPEFTPTTPDIVVPTATPTPRPGVTAVPQPTSTPTPVPEDGDQPQYGGTLVAPYGSGAWLFDLNHRGRFSWGQIGKIGNIYGQLIRIDLKDRVTVEPDLAESWSANSATEFNVHAQGRPG